jgi:hypothetical protein
VYLQPADPFPWHHEFLTELVRSFFFSSAAHMRFRKNSLTLGSTWPEAALRSNMSQFMTAVTNRRRRVLFFVVNITFLICLWALLPHRVKNAIFNDSSAVKGNATLSSIHATASRASTHDKLIANGTLGFEKIFSIGLSDRFDKRDGLELAADITNLQLTWMDGVVGGAMSPKSVPPTYKLAGVPPGVIGCWRSHMSVIQRIVKEKISSALILEDDADWDLRIVTQMQQFATATKELLGKTQNGQEKKKERKTNSPYGEGWDILWIGHCGGFHANTISLPHAIIQNDESVPPAMGMDDMLFGPTVDATWNQTGPEWHCAAHLGRDPAGKKCDNPRLAPNQRIVQERAKPVCTVSYAVSYQGARKMLARIGGLSLQDVTAPLDQGMGDICAGSTDLPGELTRCFAPSPPYVRGYKPRGPMSGDSDIRKTSTGKRDVGWSKGIMWSARLNANSIISNVDFEPESQYLKDGPKGKEKWRYRKATEYRSWKQEFTPDKWVWL